MKFYVPTVNIQVLEDCDVKWEIEAHLESISNRLVLYQWSNGYIFESDDQFQLVMAIKTGVTIPEITEQEYSQLLLDKKAYLSKGKSKKIMEAWSLVDIDK